MGYADVAGTGGAPLAPPRDQSAVPATDVPGEGPSQRSPHPIGCPEDTPGVLLLIRYADVAGTGGAPPGSSCPRGTSTGRGAPGARDVGRPVPPGGSEFGTGGGMYLSPPAPGHRPVRVRRARGRPGTPRRRHQGRPRGAARGGRSRRASARRRRTGTPAACSPTHPLRYADVELPFGIPREHPGTLRCPPGTSPPDGVRDLPPGGSEFRTGTPPSCSTSTRRGAGAARRGRPPRAARTGVCLRRPLRQGDALGVRGEPGR